MLGCIAALSCCLSFVQFSGDAGESAAKQPTAIAMAVDNAAPHTGPIRTASLNIETLKSLRTESGWANQEANRGDRSWMERHPVWTGAMIGFGAGFLITYAVTQDNDDELIKIMSPAAGGLIWGSVSAGVGALAGWGIGRNRDDP
jgi:hypothetical protein